MSVSHLRYFGFIASLIFVFLHFTGLNVLIYVFVLCFPSLRVSTGFNVFSFISWFYMFPFICGFTCFPSLLCLRVSITGLNVFCFPSFHGFKHIFLMCFFCFPSFCGFHVFSFTTVFTCFLHGFKHICLFKLVFKQNCFYLFSFIEMFSFLFWFKRFSFPCYAKISNFYEHLTKLGLKSFSSHWFKWFSFPCMPKFQILRTLDKARI